MNSKIFICEFCDLNTNNYPNFVKHKKSCDILKDNIDDFSFRYENGEALSELVKEYRISFRLGKRVLVKNSVKIRNLSESNKGKSHLHSEDSKLKISEKRKKYFQENPDRHPWKNSDKFKSVPCENFKNVLTEMGIKFIQEMSVCKERFFSVDIGIPQNKIAIEINGNQHYEKDGTLKKYYKERHEYITSFGWKVHEIHYSICFDKEVIKKTIQNIMCGVSCFEFDYENYINEKLKKSQKNICECGTKKNRSAKRCKNCYTKFRNDHIQ